MFESDLLDKLSRVHHLTPVIVYTPIILGLVIHSLTLQWLGDHRLLALVVGYLAWTLTEYFGHRFLFHTVFPLPFGLGPRFQFLIHGVHHIYPSDPLRLVMPPLLSAPIMLIALAFIRPLFGPTFGWPVLAGFIGGYVIYDCVHFWTHHGQPKSKLRPSRAAAAYAASLPRRDQGLWRACDLVGLCVRHGLQQGRHAGRSGGLTPAQPGGFPRPAKSSRARSTISASGMDICAGRWAFHFSLVAMKPPPAPRRRNPRSAPRPWPFRRNPE